MRAGDHARTQRMFRARLLAQTFTLLALCAGSAYWAEDRKKWKEFEGIVEEKKKREKNEAWIRELEARDEEDKRERERRGRRRGEGGAVRDAVARGVREEKNKSRDDGEEVEVEGKGVLDSVKGLLWKKPEASTEPTPPKDPKMPKE